MRDVLFGFLSYVVSIGAMIGTGLTWWYFFGPPIEDRDRSFAYTGGGGMVMLVVVMAMVAVFIIASTVRPSN